jgi:hypothetical protein
MPKYWIDSDGRQRLDHDENYQMVSSGTLTDDVALQMDSWDIERACRMIVLGYNENTKESIEYGLKHCAEGSTGRDRAHTLITIMNRVLTLAKSAIAIGILKETDTPKNWIAWAQGKGYNTDHLNLSIQVTPFLTMTTEGVDDAEIEPKERELMAWLRETWINEGKLGGTAFFAKLKKYANLKGSPIVEHYSAGKDAGFRWETSAGTTGKTTRKTILNIVSTFKSTP